jgi:hypothetical protein
MDYTLRLFHAFPIIPKILCSRMVRRVVVLYVVLYLTARPH